MQFFRKLKQTPAYFLWVPLGSLVAQPAIVSQSDTISPNETRLSTSTNVTLGIDDVRERARKAVPKLEHLHTEPAVALQLTSSDAVNLALRKNKLLMAAHVAIEEASASLKYAGRPGNPALTLEYASDRVFNDENQQAYSIGFQQRFPVTNRLRLLKNVSALEVQLANAELSNQKRLLIRNVEIAVDLIASLDERLSLLNEMIYLQEGFAVFLEKRIERGEASTLDLNQVRVTLFSIKQDSQSLRKKRHDAMGELRSLLGLEPNANIEILTDSFELQNLPQVANPEGDFWRSHPEYQFKTLLAEIAQGQTAIAKANRWADIAIKLFFEEERAVDEPVGLERERFLGVGVSIPLPLNDKNLGKIEAGRLREKRLNYETGDLRLRLQNEAESLRLKAEMTYQQVKEYNESAVSLVEQNLEDINRAYAAGQVDLGEVFRVQEQRLEIRTAQVELWHELKQLLIRWHAATADNLTNRTTGNFLNETE